MGFIPNECTAQMTGNYKTTYPYIETFLNTGASVPGGSALVLPTIQASYTINSGDTDGQVINDYETEFVASTSITNGSTSAKPTLDAYPSTNSCSGLGIGCTPPYQAPTARWTLTVHVPSGPPTVTSVTPNTGTNLGGHPVTIDGTGFTGATAVDFGTNAATSVDVVSDTEITADSPAGTGTVDVTVTTPGGTSTTSSNDQFTYTAPPLPTVTSVTPSTGSTSGGTPVTIDGSGFTGATAVDFGTNAATNVVVVNDGEITADLTGRGSRHGRRHGDDSDRDLDDLTGRSLHLRGVRRLARRSDQPRRHARGRTRPTSPGAHRAAAGGVRSPPTR